MSGPTASPTPEAADQAVMTSVRRCGSVNVAPRIARLFGRISAPPRPATSCPAITQATVGAPATTAPPMIMATTPAPNTRLRP